MKTSKTEYIWALSARAQLLVIELLEQAGIYGEDAERALDGRLCDLEDTIDVKEVLECAA